MVDSNGGVFQKPDKNRISENNSPSIQKILIF
jgi:hypothetical protein